MTILEEFSEIWKKTKKLAKDIEISEGEQKTLDFDGEETKDGEPDVDGFMQDIAEWSEKHGAYQDENGEWVV